ncbi:MAG: hypothetical protein Unbinned4118contig1001_11 [Prokaryotic dsDNA virus sp.]|nr:MAG: hypothetical protein Unbinned4118contig1001_11 [Prokaryotic dsDNA virus sp.]
MHGKQKVWSGVAACDCEKGRVLAMGAFPVWSDVVNQWKADDFTDKIFFGTHKEPHISFKDSVLPEVYERSQARSEDASL